MLSSKQSFTKRRQFLSGFRVELRPFALLGWVESWRSFRHFLVRVAGMLVFLGQTTKISHFLENFLRDHR